MSDLHERLRQRAIEKARVVVTDLEFNTPRRTGYLASRWMVLEHEQGATIVNDAPYVNSVERKTRFIREVLDRHGRN